MDSFSLTYREELAYALRNFARRSPFLYRMILNIRKVDPSYFVSSDSDILLAGYGGSANTYAHEALKFGSPHINIAHHLHAPAQVIHAARLRIPILSLIRHPADAIASLTTRGGLAFTIEGAGMALKDYIEYYTVVGKYHESFISCGFKDVVEDYVSVIRQVNARFGTEFTAPENGSDESKSIIKHNRFPGTRRVCPIEDVHAILSHASLAKLLAKAEQTYEEFCKLTDTRIWKDPTRKPIARRDDPQQ